MVRLVREDAEAEQTLLISSLGWARRGAPTRLKHYAVPTHCDLRTFGKK